MTRDIPNKSGGLITLPVAIIIASALIAIALIVIYKPNPSALSKNNSQAQVPNTFSDILPVTTSDHILGNPNAPIKLVEYSDPSCPYCKQYNMVMTSIIDEYGPTGNVAWVYRHLPAYKADQSGYALHPNSGTQSEAFECAGALGGNSGFFNFERKWYSVFPVDGAGRSASVDKTQLLSVAKDAGIDTVAFNNCLSTGRFKDKIEQDFNNALKAGIDGTPYTIVITPSGSKLHLSGSQPYSTVKNMVDTLITTIGNPTTNK